MSTQSERFCPCCGIRGWTKGSCVPARRINSAMCLLHQPWMPQGVTRLGPDSFPPHLPCGQAGSGWSWSPSWNPYWWPGSVLQQLTWITAHPGGISWTKNVLSFILLSTIINHEFHSFRTLLSEFWGDNWIQGKEPLTCSQKLWIWLQALLCSSCLN